MGESHEVSTLQWDIFIRSTGTWSYTSHSSSPMMLTFALSDTNLCDYVISPCFYYDILILCMQEYNSIVDYAVLGVVCGYHSNVTSCILFWSTSISNKLVRHRGSEASMNGSHELSGEEKRCTTQMGK